MIALLQKTKLVSKIMLERLRDGLFPTAADALETAQEDMEGRRFGAPLTRFRAAVPGEPIGGRRGLDLADTFDELRDDLDLLYEGMLSLGSQTIDIYDIFAVRRDALVLRMSELRVQVGTMLAQLEAGSRASVFDSFNTLQKVDLERTTARVDLTQGTVTLPPQASESSRFDSSGLTVHREEKPAGTKVYGAPFRSVFDSYRLDAWYASLPADGKFVAYVNVTGQNYQQSERKVAYASINALKIEPTGPLRVQIEFSPDGYNWHSLQPAINTQIRGETTFHFSQIQIGFLKFTFQPVTTTAPVATPGGAPALLPVGIKRIELFARGWRPFAGFYSTEHRLLQPIHTVVANLEAETPSGTQVDAFIAQSADGPWIPIGGSPVTFDNVIAKHLALTVFEPEQPDPAPALYWKAALPAGDRPLPETGELQVGMEQVQLAAFPFDWAISGDRDHLPQRGDWETPNGEIRSGVFRPLGEWDTPAVTDDAFTKSANPLAEDNRDPVLGGFMTLAIIGGDGEFCLQPGYNYRFRTYVWCPAAITLENQRLGVINPITGGGGQVVAPFSVYVNGGKAFDRDFAAESIDGLTNSFQTTISFRQGWNEFEILLQIPQDLETRAGVVDSKIAGENVFFYVQPNLFGENRERDLGITAVQAFRDPWRKVSEFELRYNVAIDDSEVWAWKLAEDGSVEYALFNHYPLNEDENTVQAVDGVNIGRLDSFRLRYSVERVNADSRSLYFRADLRREDTATAPPVLHSYRLIVN